MHAFCQLRYLPFSATSWIIQFYPFPRSCIRIWSLELKNNLACDIGYVAQLLDGMDILAQHHSFVM